MFENLMNGMTEEEATAILATTLPPELEKEAQQEVACQLFANAAYQYGHTQGQRLVAEFEGEGDITKVASAEEIQEFEAAETEAREEMDALYEEAGFADLTDPVEIEKTAQATAGFLFHGWSDAIEKIAAVKGKDGKTFVEKGRKMLGHLKGQLHKHPGKAALVAGATGAAGGYAMGKHASECTLGEVRDAVLSSLDAMSTVDEGCEKLAAKGKEKAAKSLFARGKAAISGAAAKASEHGHAALKSGKRLAHKHPGKTLGGAAVLAGGAGFAAGRASKE